MKPPLQRHPGSRWCRHIPWLLLLPALGASAQAGLSDDLPGDLDALRLADQAPEVAPAPPRKWKVFVEAAGGAYRRHDGRLQRTHRFSLDLQTEQQLTPELRFTLAHRLDLSWPAGTGPVAGEHAVNTLKEAYFGTRLDETTLLDAGRINVRNGVASGYNPTDFFRRSAVRSPISINPASLRENRQGSLMLRGQRLWDSGSLTALLSPDLHRPPSSKGWNPDLGATNQERRLLLTLSQKLAPGLTPQFLLYQESGQPVMWGVNATRLLNDSTVGYVEWAGGRRPGMLDEALHAAGRSGDPSRHWRNQLASGVTYTTPTRLSLTAEYQYHGTALADADWQALGNQPATYAAYRTRVQERQETPSRQSVFLHAQWQDAFTPRLDISLMQNRDRADRSRRSWVEARYHQGDLEYALQWQGQAAGPWGAWSSFGAIPEVRGWQLQLRHYLP